MFANLSQHQLQPWCWAIKAWIPVTAIVSEKNRQWVGWKAPCHWIKSTMLIPGKYVPALTWDFVFFFQAVQRNHQSKKREEPFWALHAQIAKNKDLKICGWSWETFWKLVDQTLHMAPCLPGCLLQRRVSEGDMIIESVQSTVFPLQLLNPHHFYCCQDQPNEGMAAVNSERENGRSQRQNVKSSNDMFFLSWQVSPGKCVIGILRVYIYISIYMCVCAGPRLT